MSNIYLETLQKYWGYPAFRPLQEEIIRSVADEKKDTLGLLPTGGGKSVIFQVPGLALEGVTLVVSPLIALMKDQVENLQKRNIPAAAIYTGMSREEILLTIEKAINREIKFLYLSPERLGTQMFLENIKHININILAVDEAHCISQWGYDFRPSYLKIADIRPYIPEVPVLALTATATPKVVDDIQEKLQFKEKNVFKKSFKRDNLIYIVKKVNNKLGHLLELAQAIKGTGVVYVRSRKKTEKIANILKQHNISADFYHAGLDPKEKDRKQDEWKHDKTRIIVATNAFGMGIDKPDVRFVIHLDLPDSLEAYFQEAGRGGRDLKDAYAFLLYNDEDIAKLKQSVEINFPPKKTIKNVYNALCNMYQIPIGSGEGRSFPFNILDFAQKYDFSPLEVYNSLKILQRNEYLEFTEEIINEVSKIHIVVSNAELYKFRVEHPKYDNFLKMLLRTYAGLFSDYVKINEYYLAKRAKVDVKLIVKLLKELDKLEIIHYLPAHKSPYLTFVSNRVETKDIFISSETYEFLKQRYIEHIEAVINYITSERCRSQLLLEYFGEYDSEECGRCDVCHRKKKAPPPNIEEQILNLLKQKPMSLQELAQKINTDRETLTANLQKLLDNEVVIYNKHKLLTLKP